MIKLKYSNHEYKMLDSFNFDKSSREIKYGNVKIDFTGLTSSDLPKKYQECQIIDDDKIMYTGYANSYAISDMKLEEDVFRSLAIELLSPMAMATVRTIIAKGTYKLNDLINLIIQPLINDGFILKELNISNRNVTVNFVIQTIEHCLNKLSNENNFWWYIDENKNIYINDISYQFSKDVVFTFDNKPPKGLYEIVPTIDIEDYCNVINIKNVRVYSASIYYESYELNKIIDKNVQIKNGDTIKFFQSIDIAVKNIKKSYEELKESIKAYDIGDYPPAIYFEGITSKGIKTFYVRVKDDILNVSSNVQFSGDGTTSEDEKEFELQKDSFFSNLITGFRYKGSEPIIKVNKLISISCLKWTNVKFYDNVEIENQKGVVNQSGQIEKTIDLNEQWKLMSEVTSIARSYLDINSGSANSVKLYCDVKQNIGIGDIVEINKPKFLLDDAKYICTDISYQYYNENNETYVYELRNKNYLSNYIDLFRSKDSETTTEKIETLVISNYIEEEIQEVHEVV